MTAIDLANLKKRANDEAHACARIFPLLDDVQLSELIEDIRQNGLRQAIIKDPSGLIVDGRNRFIGCLGTDTAIRFETLPEDTDIPAMVASLNIHRRHLPISVRAAIAADLANLKRGGTQPAKSPDAVSQADAAKVLSLSERTVRTAACVKAADPALHEQVKAGTVSLRDAARKVQANKPKATRHRDITAPAVATSSAIPAIYATLFTEHAAFPSYLVTHPLTGEAGTLLLASMKASVAALEGHLTSSILTEASDVV